MDRLAHSSAAKTLRSLDIVEPFGSSLSLTRTISLDAFRYSICNLSALESLKLEQVSIGNYVTVPKSTLQRRRGGLAPKVKSPSLLLGQPMHTRVAIMELFPNLESLAFDSFGSMKTFVNFFPRRYSFPFPWLKLLDVPLSGYWQLRESNLMQSWLSIERRVQLATLDFLPNSDLIRLRKSSKRLAKALSNNHISVRHLRIDGSVDPEWMYRVLDLSTFENLQALEIVDLGSDLLNDLEGGDGFSGSPQYQVDMTNLFTKAKWKRILTRLCIPSPLDDFWWTGCQHQPFNCCQS